MRLFTVIVTSLLILLWSYALFSKLLNLRKFKHALMMQVFPRWTGNILIYLLPLLEIVIIILLFFQETRILGMYSSLFLLTVFTLYVGGAMYGIYDRYPCACGGLFGKLGWRRHFTVNLILTLISLIGVILMN